MVTHNRENNPNAALFISALRNLGYNNISAINDIIDNSLDADADEVVVRVIENNGRIEIRIVDNGYGMDENTLDQALRLGSEVERDVNAELGKFGMGLSTASISISRRLEVLTKEEGSDKILKSYQDLDDIKKTNQFVKYIGEANEEDQKLYRNYLGEVGHGTIIRMIDCDRLTDRRVNHLASRLTGEIGRTFREYINAGRNFYVNGVQVRAEDIFLLDEGGKIYSDEQYEVKVKDDSGKEVTETIRVRLGILPDFGKAGNQSKGINPSNQGFYLMRNNREIERGKTLRFYSRHPEYNRFRGEIYFSAPLDDKMGVNFQKKGVDLETSIFDKINADVKHQLRAIVNSTAKERAATDAEEIDHSDSVRHISKKAPLLKTPKATEEDKKKPKGTDKPEGGRGKDKAPRKKSEDLRARFIAEHHGKAGYIYETRQEGKTTIIAWNIDHPFYERFVVANKGDKTMATSIDFLIYSLATAELDTMNDDNIEMIENLKATMSRNLNTLLR